MKANLNPLSNTNPKRTVEVLSIGTEILLGNIVNSNSQWIAEELSALGLNHFRQTTIGDNLNRISNLITEISKRSSLLITTGGLGPTPDDLTTEAIAKAFNSKLREREYIWNDIKKKLNNNSKVDLIVRKTFLSGKINFSFGLKNIFDVQDISSFSAAGVHSSSSNSQSVAYGRTFFTSLNFKF